MIKKWINNWTEIIPRLFFFRSVFPDLKKNNLIRFQIFRSAFPNLKKNNLHRFQIFRSAFPNLQKYNLYTKFDQKVRRFHKKVCKFAPKECINMRKLWRQKNLNVRKKTLFLQKAQGCYPCSTPVGATPVAPLCINFRNYTVLRRSRSRIDIE